jgi:hypothetical protein
MDPPSLPPMLSARAREACRQAPARFMLVPMRTSLRVLAAASLVSLVACDAPVSSGDRDPNARLAAAGTPAAPAQLARPVVKTIEVADVRWPARDSIDAASLARLSEAAREAVARSRVPVLLPKRDGLLARAVVMPSAHYTAVSIPAEDPDHGVTVSLQANRIAHRYAEVPPALGRDVVRGHDAWITQNEGIWSASWTEHGVSYVLELECARPGDDPRCASDATLRALAEELVFIGGSFEEGGAR